LKKKKKKVKIEGALKTEAWIAGFGSDPMQSTRAATLGARQAIGLACYDEI
jgi:hypothetical protein